jgi:hypothetical protein
MPFTILGTGFTMTAPADCAPVYIRMGKKEQEADVFRYRDSGETT